MRALFVIALIAVAAFADYSFIPGANLTDASGNFSYRWQKTKVVDISSVQLPGGVVPPKKIFAWVSASVDAEVASSAALLSANGMASGAFPPSESLVPMIGLGYGSGEASVTTTLEAFVFQELSGQGVAIFEGGMVGIAAVSMQEMTPDGVPVANTRKYIRGNCDPQEIHDGSVSGLTCSIYSQNTRITITYVSSTEAGVINYAATPVSPRSVDMIIEVDGFPLTDDNNHARIDFALLTGQGKAVIQGNATVIEKDSEKIYAALSSKCVVNNNVEDVNVTFEATGDLSAVEYYSRIMLQYVVEANFTGRIAHVDFPAGVRSFVYDPAVGSGSIVYEAEPEVSLKPTPTPDGANTVALSLLAALVCALLFLF